MLWDLEYPKLVSHLLRQVYCPSADTKRWQNREQKLIIPVHQLGRNCVSYKSMIFWWNSAFHDSFWLVAVHHMRGFFHNSIWLGLEQVTSFFFCSPSWYHRIWWSMYFTLFFSLSFAFGFFSIRIILLSCFPSSYERTQASVATDCNISFFFFQCNCCL